jgi:hypothetical protein
MKDAGLKEYVSHISDLTNVSRWKKHTTSISYSFPGKVILQKTTVIIIFLKIVPVVMESQGSMLRATKYAHYSLIF